MLCDDTWPGEGRANCLFVSPQAMERQQAGAPQRDGIPSRRAIAVIAAEAVDRLMPQMPTGLTAYVPVTRRDV